MRNFNGRPLKFKSVEELQEKIDAYFKSCYKEVRKENGEVEMVNIRPLTITGLALALDTDRITLLRYEECKQDSLSEEENRRYSNTIKAAKQTIENFAEEKLFSSSQVVGVIFNMKNNWGWKDKTEVEYSEPPKKLDLDEIERLEKENKDTNKDE